MLKSKWTETGINWLIVTVARSLKVPKEYKEINMLMGSIDTFVNTQILHFMNAMRLFIRILHHLLYSLDLPNTK